MPKRILIVGGVAGGMSAATRLRRLDESAEILVFERGPHVSFANCGLPYFLGGEITDKSKLLVQTPERLRAVFNLDVRPQNEVLAIQPEVKQVEIRELTTGRIYSENYDELILSPGASALVPPIPGIDRPGHFLLRNIPDLEKIVTWIETQQAKTAVVVGGGYIGLEAVEQLHKRGLKISIAEVAPQVLAPFDPEMAALVHGELRANGVQLHLSDGVARFDAPTDSQPAKASIVELKSGTRIPADLVILALGVRPEVKLAKEAGLALGPNGGIQVDRNLKTSVDHIWAIGDAIEVSHGVTGQASLIALAGPANRQGRTVADNIYGRGVAYRNSIGTAILRVFRQTAACTGANESLLKKNRLAYQAVHLHPNSHAGYYPGAHPIALKLLFSPETRKVLGAQAVGVDGVDKRIDVLATAIKAGMTIDDLADLELCYAPPFGSAKDPINLAGMVAQNVLNGDVQIAQWHEVPTLVKEGALILDVREPKERDSGIITGSLGIPLGELRKRLSELPRDQEILVHCASGQRSYNACRVLLQNGFRCRNLTGSYKTWLAAQPPQQS